MHAIHTSNYCTCMHLNIFSFCPQWLPLPIFCVYRVLISLYVLGWLLAAGGVYSSADARFLTYLTNQSYILLAAGFLWRAAISIVYTACHYGSGKKLAWLFPISVDHVYSQDNTRWYLKISWFIHTTSTVLAVGVALGYWAFLCTAPKSSPNQNTTTYNETNLTQSQTCQPTAPNLHLHGVNAIIAVLDILISRVPFQLYHFFYTSILTILYLIFSLIYWGAYHRTKSGVIYSILDYGNNPYAGLFVVVLILLPMLLYLVLFVIVMLRDLICEALQKLLSRKLEERTSAGKEIKLQSV